MHHTQATIPAHLYTGLPFQWYASKPAKAQPVYRHIGDRYTGTPVRTYSPVRVERALREPGPDVHGWFKELEAGPALGRLDRLQRAINTESQTRATTLIRAKKKAGQARPASSTV